METTSLSREGPTTDQEEESPSWAESMRNMSGSKMRGADCTLVGGGGGDGALRANANGETAVALVEVATRVLLPLNSLAASAGCWFLLRPVLGMAEYMRARSLRTLSVRGTLPLMMSCCSIFISSPKMEEENTSLSDLLTVGWSEYWNVLRVPLI